MVNFLSQLNQQNSTQGEKLETEALIVAQKLLVSTGLSFIPNSYIEFLKHCNGVKANGAYLFGATVDNDLDIVDKNEQMIKPADTLLLGYNDFDLLVYNYQNQCYQIIDRDDLNVLDCYKENELDYALTQIFNV